MLIWKRSARARLTQFLFLSAIFLLNSCAGFYGGNGYPSPVDKTSPSVPTGLYGNADSTSQLTLTWEVSTDDTEVAGYHVYRDDTLYASISTNEIVEIGLASFTTYSYRVTAYDSAENESEKSDEVQITTKLSVDDIINTAFYRITGNEAKGAVLDVGQAGSWYDHIVGTPSVEFDGAVYRMWFAGGPDVYPGNNSIGLAYSTDGICWTLTNGGEPVFTPGPPDSFDQQSVQHPMVLRVSGRYMMWYGGSDGMQAPNLASYERIGLATSDDGENWSRENNGNPVLDLGPTGSIDDIQATGCFVMHKDGIFTMWYGAYRENLHTIAAATSADGIHWIKLGVAAPLETLDFEQAGVLGPSVYFDGESFLMLYSKISDSQWKIFGSTSANGIDWEPAWDGKPILGPPIDNAFDSAGPGKNHSVHPSQIILHDGRISVWYHGETTETTRMRIGLMEAYSSN